MLGDAADDSESEGADSDCGSSSADEGGRDAALAAIGEGQSQYHPEFQQIFDGAEQIDADKILNDDDSDDYDDTWMGQLPHIDN